MLISGVALLLALSQQLPVHVPTGTGLTSPASGDTVGYWQQRVHYTITATLDERAQRIRATGTLRYVNNSPDTLREMYFHQYLNAFRPASLWSRVDEREGRTRFQRLRDPHYAYERFTAPVRVNGISAAVSYPGAPDSTVARIALPELVLPGDSVTVEFQWDARPSTLPRRQGRRGRHWDLAQWYPKVAVYDRGGWEYNALQPAGEFYGEFGTYDVTLVVADDQVIAATGVPVSGDPGWTQVLREGIERRAAHAYGNVTSPAPAAPSGYKAVRFLAHDVHHFAWSVNPDFRYEGGIYTRQLPPTRFRAWDTVSVHVLYQPGDDTTWGGLRVLQRTINALRWLEDIYGPYAYPQMTVMHRIEGGGTEFPMLQANGSPSQGLILHEGGHVWSYGILANNEWRSGWLDEGLTSYQTAWAQGLTPLERFRTGTVDRFVPITGYGALALRMRLPRFEALNLGQALADLNGRAEPIGTVAHEFRDFGTYNSMVYNRAEVMYSQLRDALGDSAFLGFLQDYYSRWALKHVDERAMRASAERASARELDWFFRQWVHRTGVMDYALGDVSVGRDSSGWITHAEVMRRGEYRHPISVGVRTAGGWTLARMAQPPFDREVLQLRTAQEPLEVRIDPLHLSWDWDRRNDVRSSGGLTRASVNFDWPFLEQADRERDVLALGPMVWYSSAGGVAGGLRGRRSYLGIVDRSDGGVTYYVDPRVRLEHSDQVQLWWRFWNLYLPGMSRPAMGLYGGVGHLDGVLRLELGQERTSIAGRDTRTLDFALNYVTTLEPRLAPELFYWEVLDLSARARTQQQRRGGYAFFEPSVLVGLSGDKWLYRAEAAYGRVAENQRARVAGRLYGGITQAPFPRALFLSSEDPVATYWNHWWRPRGALLKRPGFNFLPLGGAGMRGYAADVSTRRVVALNGDAGIRLGSIPRLRTLALSAHAFGDVAATPEYDVLGDAGVGLSIRGELYDRSITVRLDAPLYVSHPLLAVGFRGASADAVRPRWVVTLQDLWF